MGIANPVEVDIVEAGSGPTVVLIHSSVAGARQWRRLMSDLQDRFHLIAINLFGYGRTPAWPGHHLQGLADQAKLVEAIAPSGDRAFSLIGHSFGGSVAMKAAASLGSRINKLILLEPNPFYLLEQHGRHEAFEECSDLRDCVRTAGLEGNWLTAAERFADYWSGNGTWEAMPEERRTTFIDALKPNFHEWDAVFNETTTLPEWANSLPVNTAVLSARETARPVREIAELMQKHCPDWRYEQISQGGHMAPLIRPDIVNPIIASILEDTNQQT